MGETLQIILLAVAVVALYVISSRWLPREPSLLGVRASFWIGLAAAIIAVILVLLGKRRTL